MRGPIQNALRLFTRAIRPLALRSAGKQRSSTSVVRHVGRRSGRTYQTPVNAVQHEDSFLIALPYGKRTDWLNNVPAKGSATIVTNGHTYQVDRPEVIPTAEATAYFRPRQQRMHRQFHVDLALRVRQRPQAPPRQAGLHPTRHRYPVADGREYPAIHNDAACLEITSRNRRLPTPAPRTAVLHDHRACSAYQ